MQRLSDQLPAVVAALDPSKRHISYEACGSRVLSRVNGPKWLSLDEAGREAIRITAEIVHADDPGSILPRFTQLVWAIRDAREADNDPTPPAMAQAA